MSQAHPAVGSNTALPLAAASSAAAASSSAPAAVTPAAAAAVAPIPASAYLPPSVEFRGVVWYSLSVAPVELRLDITLKNGQCFGWTRVDPTALEEAKVKGKRKRSASATTTAAITTTAPATAAAAAAAASPSTVKLESDETMTASSIESSAVKMELSADAASAAASSTPLDTAAANALPLDGVRVKLETMADSSASSSSSSAAAAGSAAASSSIVAPAALTDDDPHYIGVLGHSVIGIRQTASDILYREHATSAASPTPPAQLDVLLRDYFHLPSTSADSVTGLPSHADMVLATLYPAWSLNATRRFQFVARIFPGVRLLRQEPLETLFSFICSSNNHISRIGGMLASLRAKYGQRIPVAPGVLPEGTQQRAFYQFPTLDGLCAATEPELRALGFGYRAKYIVSSALLLRERGGSAYLHTLRARPRAEVERALEAFAGVGPKVASCIALFSLDQIDAIPVDTHVWQIAVRDYAKAGPAGMDLTTVKSLTPRVYQAVGDIFRTLFGAYAGWAHCILFLAELPEFKRKLAEQGINELQLEEGAAAATQAKSSKASKAEQRVKQEEEEAEETEDDEEQQAEPATPAAVIVVTSTKPKKQTRGPASTTAPPQTAASGLSQTFPQRKNAKRE